MHSYGVAFIPKAPHLFLQVKNAERGLQRPRKQESSYRLMYRCTTKLP